MPIELANSYIIKEYQVNFTLEGFMEIQKNYLKERLFVSLSLLKKDDELIYIIKHTLGLKAALTTSLFKDFAELILSHYIFKEFIDSEFVLIVKGDDIRIKNGSQAQIFIH